MPKHRHPLPVLALTGAVCLVGAAHASAAINVSSAGGIATVTAEPGTADEIFVQQSTVNGGNPLTAGTKVRVNSDTTPLVAGAGCTKISYPDGSSQVVCDLATTINVDAGDGDDTVGASENARALPPTFNINLGDGNDLVEGIETDGPNAIDGGPGDDTIDMGDTVFGGEGNDVIAGEILNGGEGNDQLSTPKKTGGDYKVGAWHGDEGNDVLQGSERSPFDDVLFGDDGKDKLYGGAGRDKLNGGADKDYCDGGPVGDKKKKKADTAKACETAVDVYVKPKKK